MYRRIQPLIVVIAAVGALAAGCGSSGPADAGPPPSTYVDAGTFTDGGNWCEAVSSCCPTLPAPTACTDAVNSGNGPDCENILTGAQGRGLCIVDAGSPSDAG